MSNKRVKAAKQLLNFILVVKASNKQHVSKVIELYIESKIEKFKEAENLLIKLTSRGLRPKTAIEKINSYSERLPAIGKLSRPVKPKQTPKPMITQTYHVSGTILTKSQYFWNDKKQIEKSKAYSDREHDAMKIKAISKEMAIKHYEKIMTEKYTLDRHTADDGSMNFKNRKVLGFENIHC
jgi:hypothetical protein